MSDSLGSQLKKKRENLQLSIDDVAKKTRISRSTLIAIEAGDHSRLPAKPFVRGFVRTYAKIVGLNPNLAVSLFEQEIHEGALAPAPKAPEERDDQSTDKESVLWFQASRSFFIALGLLSTVFLCFLIYYTMNKFERYDREASLPTPTEVSPSVPNSTGSLTFDQKTPKIDEAPLAKDIKTKDAVAAKAPPKKEKTPPLKKKPLSKVRNKSPKPPHQVTVHASKNVDLSIVWSTGQSQSFSLKAKEIKNILFSNPVTIRLARADGAKVVFDKKNIPIPENSEEPVELKFP